jgi:hypothetical protein
LYTRSVRVRGARLGVVGLAIACLSIACNAIFDIRDPNPSAAGGGGGTSNVGGSSGSGGQNLGGSSAGSGGEASAGTGGEAGGSGGASGDAGPLDGPTVTLSGVVRRFESGEPSGGVEVTAFVGATTRIEATSSAGTGQYTIAGIAPGSTVNVEIEYSDEPERGLPTALLQTRIRVEVGNEPEQQLDLPTIDYDWLTRTANECGAVQDTSLTPELFFARSATLVVEARAAGMPVAGLSRDTLEIGLGNGGTPQPNLHDVERDPADTNPTFVCVLEQGSDGELVGGQQTVSTSLGRFIVFRVRNAQGTGSGEAVVSLPDGDPSSVNLRQSGQSGVVLLGD